ncbi:MAG: SH3 domain-containing protein [Acidobacteriota bacterium]
MARIIEYNEGEYGEGRSGGGGSAALLVVVILVILYFTGYLPGFTSASPRYDQRGYVAPTSSGTILPTGNIGYVSADRLNMRDAPGGGAPITYILPRGTRVTVLGESYQEPSGSVWLKVQIDTYEGLQIGWVNRQYIS